MGKRGEFPALPAEFEELLAFERSEVKNIDLLYRYLNMVYSELVQKREALEEASNEKESAYLEGQIAGFKVANAIIEAFFDH